MKKLLTKILILVCLSSYSLLNAQQGTKFDFEIFPIDDVNNEIQIKIFDATNVQFIEIYLMDGSNQLSMSIASLNRKKDNKYYIFYKNKESVTSLNSIIINVENEFGILESPSILIKLMDKENQQIDSYQKTIN